MKKILGLFLITVNAYGGIFLDGQRFIEESLPNRQAYVMGLIDGLNTGGKSIKASDDKWYSFTELLPHCLDPNLRTNGQLEAMITKYLKAHPELWHLPMYDLGPTALQQSGCK